MGKAQEKRDAELKAAAKKAEKDAKKAALKQAREEKKKAKEEEKTNNAVVEEEEEEEREPPVPSNEWKWTPEEQAKLDEGLMEYEADLGLVERWTAIAALVGGGRSKRACAARFKEVKGNVLAQREHEDWEDEQAAARLARAREKEAKIAAKGREAYDEALEKLSLEADLKAQAEFEVGGAGGAVCRGADDDGAAADRLASQGVIATFSAPPVSKHRNAKDISVSNLSVSFHGAPILEGTEFSMNWGNRYGFIGRNGSGKSTVMRVLGARAVPIPASINIFHLTTEYPATDETALYAVMKVDAERAKTEKEIEELNDALADLAKEDAGDDAAELTDDLTERLNTLYERLEEMEADTAETRACAILTGLGFSTAMQQKKTRDFSGGWRMRVALARALFIAPELLLLDEPTNHLDMEAVVWLEDYLSRWTKMLFMVCHSQDFLNNVCTHIVHLDSLNQRLTYYRGNYDQFVEERRVALNEQRRQYDKEQADIREMKEYVAKFGHGTAKLARQGKSREKLLNKKLQGGLTEKPVEEEVCRFKFGDPGTLPPPVLQVNSLTFGYPGCPDLYTDVDFGLDLDSRVALVGPNGAGKSTLVKIINGELVPRAGQVRPHSHLKMVKFTQHFEDVLDLDMTPLDWLMAEYVDLTRDEARKWLGRYGTSGAVQLQAMSQLSEGQKAKVVFCKMAKENAHMLLLDEPTNALDMEMIDSLAQALNDFTGGVVLVSHDMRLISQVAKEIWIIDKGVRVFKGDISDFKMDLRNQMQLGDNAMAAMKKKKQLTMCDGSTAPLPPAAAASSLETKSTSYKLSAVAIDPLSFKLDPPRPPATQQPVAAAAPAYATRADALRDSWDAPSLANAPPARRASAYVPPSRRAAPDPQKGDGAW